MDKLPRQARDRYRRDRAVPTAGLEPVAQALHQVRDDGWWLDLQSSAHRGPRTSSATSGRRHPHGQANHRPRLESLGSGEA